MKLSVVNVEYLYIAVLFAVAALIFFGMNLKLKKYSLSFSGFILKLFVTLLMLIVLAGPRIEEEKQQSQAKLLLDISESVDELVAQKLLDKAARLSDEGLSLSVVPFAAKSGTALPATTDLNYRAIRRAWSKLDIGQSDIATALRQNSLSSSGSILIITDGYETKGVVGDLKQLLARGDSRIFPLVPQDTSAEQSSFKISNFYAPMLAPAEKSVQLRLTISNSSTEKQRGTVEVKQNNKVLLKEKILVAGGKSKLIRLDSNPENEGISELVATLTPESKSMKASVSTTFVSNQLREKILLASSSAADERFFKQILSEQAYRLKSVTGSKWPEDWGKFSDYSVVILNNIPRQALPGGAMEALEAYVSEGGRLIMVGGNRSFGLGGYIDTPVSRLLPVKLLPPQKIKKRVNVAVALVLDKSRSMAFGNKIDYAKDAAQEVIRNLKDPDYVSVIGFDTTPFIAVPLALIGKEREAALNRVGRLFPAGKTNLYPALDEARRNLLRSKAGRKHMIVLTDGKIPDAGPYYLELVRQMRLLGITVSTVMMGQAAGGDFLRSMAELGGGAYYQTTNARNLPRIFLSDLKVSTGEETMKERQEYLVRLGPEYGKSTKLRNFPPVKGYVQTARRTEASLELVAEALGRAEPLLASWNYKRGKVAAFTSDANGRWSAYWAKWDRFRAFWVELIDSLRPQQAKEARDINFELRPFVEGDRLILDLAVYNEDVPPPLRVKLLLPGEAEKTLEFDTLSKGLYRTSLSEAIAGKYEARIYNRELNFTPVAFYLSGELFGEQKGRGFNLPLLSELAGISGGKLNPSATDLRTEVYKNKSFKDLSHHLFLMALVLLCFEIFRRDIWRGIAIFKNKTTFNLR